MAGILTASAGATSFRFLNGRRLSPATSTGSTSNAFYIRFPNTLKASLHAVIDEPLVETTKIRPESLYDVLNVRRNATPCEIKSAYRSLAKRYHPDALDTKRDGDGDSDRDFIDIHNAYVTLSDPTSRALYDLKLSTGFQRRSGGIYGGDRRSYGGRRWETDQCW